MPGVISSMAYVIVRAETEEELEQTLKQEAQKFKDSYLTLNRDQCFFHIQQVEMRGHGLLNRCSLYHTKTSLYASAALIHRHIWISDKNS